jgi:hypothetical protein
MWAGEYDASQEKFHQTMFNSSFLFIFILSAMMMYNFINGLAIDDIQKLREKAEFYDTKSKIYSITLNSKYREFLQDKKIFKTITKLIFKNSFNIAKCSVMSENKVVYNIVDNGNYKCFDAKIDSTLNVDIKNLLQRQKPRIGDLFLSSKIVDLSEKHDKMEQKLQAGDLHLSNKIDKMEHTLGDLVKSLEELLKKQ